MTTRNITFTTGDITTINALNSNEVVVGSYINHLKEAIHGIRGETQVKLELNDDMVFQAIRAESFCDDESGILYHIASEFIH
ncbi:hypothetical protein LMH73_018170 [Vibrio splendidus]|nr:hypothetical protein [Vibrio splendidus]MCC4882941.1 hypothetical protein [Vibrio splendidus]